MSPQYPRASSEVAEAYKVIPDLPQGPLCAYRRRVAFDWKRLKIFFEGAEPLLIKYKVWSKLEHDPLFARSPTLLSTDEQKRLCAMQMNRMAELQLVPAHIEESRSFSEKTKYLMSINEALHTYCPSLSVKIALGVGLFNNAIRAMGTERHLRYYRAAWHRQMVTCLAITEMSHGSNTKRIRTTATYDPNTQQFIINTPDVEAAKCWVGNLGKTATIAMTFANLITPDGECHGLHGFLIPIRDPYTLQPYPGILVGDIGEKVGLNGIDNGFIVFSNYRIPRENLLNRTGDVTADGHYESVFSEPGKILGAALESFSAGRIGIMQESVNTLSSAAVIAVRYAALRRQFGPERDGEEMPIIEYQLHQWRIFPYLAAACVLKVAVRELTNRYLAIIESSQSDSNGFELLNQVVTEMHAIISASKAMITWTARDALQEAREACGGNGYLKASKLGDLRNDHDPSCTYEGDNNVLGQQASNWLLKQSELLKQQQQGGEQSNETLSSSIGTANFLKRSEEIRRQNYRDVLQQHPIESFSFPLHCYEWLLCHLLEKTEQRVNGDLKAGLNRFEARNNSQVYAARELSLAYAEYFCMTEYVRRCHQLDQDEGENGRNQSSMREILHRLYRIYALWCIDRRIANFYMGDFASCGSTFADLIRSELLRECALLKDAAVAVADALAPPDFALDSVIGKSDGQLYDNIWHEFLTNSGALQRPTWWRDILLHPSNKSKL